MRPQDFFSDPTGSSHKQYEALRAFFLEEISAQEVAARFGYTVSSVYSLVRDFKKQLKKAEGSQRFFVLHSAGRKSKDPTGKIYKLIIELRKKYLSVPDIKAILDSQENSLSEKQIYNIIKKEGFARLPRRNSQAKEDTLNSCKLIASKSTRLDYSPETFCTHNSIGILCLLPYVKEYGLHKLIESSLYPETKTIPKISAILSFVALKLSNVRRYTADDLWCMDRGLGLFAGLNVLPKAAWFTSYSHRVTRKANLAFLKSLHQLWVNRGLLSDTANLDFATIPYWGDDSHLENNWSGTRHKALASLLAVLAQDPDTGIITYGDTNIRHKNKDEVALEFLDFYSEGAGQDLKYLVFDSKFTTYQNLRKLDEDKTRNIKFITIRRRGKNIVKDLEALECSEWKKVRVPTGDGKTRQLRIHDTTLFLKDYGKEIRQIAITGHGKIKPALIITNDFEIAPEGVIRKYAQRWLVEKEISEQTHFFHLNGVSSSMVIKVDFDLTMTILAHNLYRLIAADLPGYTHSAAVTLFEKFFHNSGDVQITPQEIIIQMKKKRNLPALLTAMESYQKCAIPWMDNRRLIFSGATRS